MNLQEWGQNFHFEIVPPLTLARIVEEHKSHYILISNQGLLQGKLAGKLHHPSREKISRPTVGDWVVVKPIWEEYKGIIQEVLPRKSVLHRKAAGNEPYSQVLAANVDQVFLVTSLNKDFNEKRLDRYLSIIRESKATPILILSKKDLEPESEEVAQELRAKYNIECFTISSFNPSDIDKIKNLLPPSKTSVFVGSSGVGKSTLINALMGKNEQQVGEIRESDDRGRHTTTYRKLILLDNKSLVIDTPGLREIQLDTDHDSGVKQNFLQIDSLAIQCKFSNCLHDTEPHCAVKNAIENGELSAEQLVSYQKLIREIARKEKKKRR